MSAPARSILVVAFVCFLRGWIGGGDAKLAAATALWFGFDYLMNYLFYASLLGGALTLLLIQFRTTPLPALLAQQEWVQRLHQKDGGVPYGIALAAARSSSIPTRPGWQRHRRSDPPSTAAVRSAHRSAASCAQIRSS